MKKETYRELEDLAVQAVKTGLQYDNAERLTMGLAAIQALHAIRFAAPNLTTLPDSNLD